MVEVIIGGAIMLVGGVVGAVVQHLLQRMRNKDEREARREEIIFEKQLEKQMEAFGELVRVLYITNGKWLEMIEVSKEVWIVGEAKVEGEEAQRQRMETLRALGAEYKATIKGFVTIIDESQKAIAGVWAYLPQETQEVIQRYNGKAVKNMKLVTGLMKEGGEVGGEDFNTAQRLVQSEYASAVASLRGHIGIKERLQPR